MDGQTTELKQRQRRTAPKEVRRQQLIDATLKVLAEKGFSGTTMATVTRQAGLSTGIVSLHFASKDNLLAFTLRYLSEEKRGAWVSIYRDKSLSAAVRLHGILSACFNEQIATPTKIAVWFAFFGEVRYRQLYRDMVADDDDERVDAIEVLCTEIVQDGGYDNVDPRSLAMTIECLCDGLWLNMIIYPNWLPKGTPYQMIIELLYSNFPSHFDKYGPTSTEESANK